MKSLESIELTKEEAESLKSRLSSNNLSKKDINLIGLIIDSVILLNFLLSEAKISINTLSNMIFRRHIKNNKENKADDELEGDNKDKSELKTNKNSDDIDPEDNKNDHNKNQGRMGVESYTGADTVNVKHPTIKDGILCPV